MSVCLSFLICWAPFHMQRLFARYWNLDQSSSNTSVLNSDFNVTTKEMIMEQAISVRDVFTWWHVLVYYATGLLYYSSAAINPVLYNVMSSDFRLAFLRMCRCRFRRITSSICRIDQPSTSLGQPESGPHAFSFIMEQPAIILTDCSTHSQNH